MATLRTSWLMCLVIGMALLLPSMPGQTFYGSVVGTVTDASGALIHGASVGLTNTGTGERRDLATGNDGTYRFVNLVPGRYRLDIEQSGFKHYTRDGVTVEVEAAVRIDVAMQIGDVTQALSVTAEAPLLQTENASLSQVVSGRSVQELPLDGRNVLNLVQLVPGVVPQGYSGGSLTGKNVFAAGNYQIGGGTANQSAALYDGMSMNTTYGNLIALVPTQDAVSEFRVQTNNLTAEYGRYTGGVVNLTSKSGTNDYHGSLYEYFRNTVLNANQFFANARGLGKVPFTQNVFGGGVGGPIKKNKLFFFGSYEGFRQRQGFLYTLTVPTPQMLLGDFSDLKTAAGALVPIYDPLTNCGQLGNAACASSSGPQRTAFPSNQIPADRMNPVSKAFAKFPSWGTPNLSGAANTHTNNFSQVSSIGGDNDQGNIRGDYNVSDKQHLIARYTHWDSRNLGVNVYGNGFYDSTNAPEIFTTDQAILADTYSLGPTTVLDLRLGFMRWYYTRQPGNSRVYGSGVNLARDFGMPQYMTQIPILQGLGADSAVVSRMEVSGYGRIGTGLYYGRDNNYVITPNLTRVSGKHTFKFGGEVRRQDVNYFQNAYLGGVFTFDNILTSQNALSPGSTGNSIASFLLGYPASGLAQMSPMTAGGMHYQGYYVNDTIMATGKLTLNVGLRWEIPGVYTERFDRQDTFNPYVANPVMQTAGVKVNGQPILGRFDLVSTPDHPERGLRPEHFDLFAPRVGIAYRLSNKTVIRTGIGVFYVPGNVQFTEGPTQDAINYFNNPMVGSINSGVTPLNTMSNPFPAGFTPAPGRNPNYQQLLLGIAVNTPLENVRYPYTVQWNFTVQHQFPKDVALEAAYTGLRGIFLPQGAAQMNQINPSYLPLGTQLQQQVPNPMYGLISYGTLAQPTVQRGLLMLPFPEYASMTDVGGYFGNSVYHALQAKVEKRFSTGGTVLAAYTLSKILTNVETLTTWLDAGTGVATVQNWYDMRGERALSSFDTHQRLVASYVLDLPAGKGRKLFTGAGRVADKIVSGWGINGTTTFQQGFPLGLTASPNVTGFNTGLRPNVVAGCDPVKSGPAQARLTQWFNTSCYTVPGAFTFGSASRTDPRLRGHGINNFDFALFKKTAITERFKLEFRAEVFNLFNRVQFGNPNLTDTTASTTTFGVVSSQLNQPRLIQFGLRLSY